MGSFNILGTQYKVKKENLEHLGAEGMCLPREKIILIDKKLKGNDLLETIIHEFGHGVFTEGSLRQAVTPELEEIIVDLMARCLVKNFSIKQKK